MKMWLVYLPVHQHFVGGRDVRQPQRNAAYRHADGVVATAYPHVAVRMNSDTLLELAIMVAGSSPA
jgi:hypothetical protein